MKEISVTFDTNVINHLLSPESCNDAILQSNCIQIKELINAGKIRPHVSETIFNLEELERMVRPNYFGSYEPTLTIESIETGDSQTIQQRICISPNINGRPEPNSYWIEKLAGVRGLGFKFLSAPRTGMPINPLLAQSDFGQRDEQEMRKQQSRFFDAIDFVCQLGAGIEVARKLGNDYRTNEDTWYEALKKAPINRVAKAIAEWSDGDSVAAHISYGVNIFCTMDKAKAAGSQSIFSEENRNKLNERFGTIILTPEELLASMH